MPLKKLKDTELKKRSKYYIMKRIDVVVVGVGNRGKIYADYALRFPDEMKVVGVVEPNENLRKDFCIETWNPSRKSI